jgi:hypothetical protein
LSPSSENGTIQSIAIKRFFNPFKIDRERQLFMVQGEENLVFDRVRGIARGEKKGPDEA